MQVLVKYCITVCVCVYMYVCMYVNVQLLTTYKLNTTILYNVLDNMNMTLLISMLLCSICRISKCTEYTSEDT